MISNLQYFNIFHTSPLSLPYNIFQLNNLVLLQSWLQLFLEFGGEEEKYRNILHVLEKQLKKPTKIRTMIDGKKPLIALCTLKKIVWEMGANFDNVS